jgi:hypothetical protein
MDEFPIGIHLIFIPATLALGFILGWILRGAAAGPPRRPRPERRPSGSEPDGS